MELFTEYITIDTDLERSIKVAKAIKNKLSEEMYQMVCKVASSNHIGKADLIYRFLILGFHVGPQIINHLSDSVVSKMIFIEKYVTREILHYYGFVRFHESEDQLLISIIQPKNNIIPLIAPHFADRFPQERFVICDDKREIAVLHVPNKPWVLVSTYDFPMEQLETLSYSEDRYQKLWNIFFEHIAIEDRKNSDLQRNLLPLRFRKNMTEFKLNNTINSAGNYKINRKE